MIMVLIAKCHLVRQELPCTNMTCLPNEWEYLDVAVRSRIVQIFWNVQTNFRTRIFN